MRLLIFLLLPTFVLAQWRPQTSGTEAGFRAVSAASARVVWVGGANGTFVRTTDGGATWRAGAVPGADSCDFRDVHALNDQVAFLMSAGPAERGLARLYKTTDGGRSWTLLYQTRQPGVFFDSMDFWNADEGLVVSDPVDGKWFVLRTRDGGRNWERIAPDNLPPMQPGEAAFAASGTSLVVEGRRNAWIASGGGSRGRVFRTTDGGATWQVSDTPLPAGPTTGLFGLWYGPNGRGIAVGGDYKNEKLSSPNVAVTTDGGRTWQVAAPTDPPGLKEGVISFGSGRWLAVGPSGTCLTADFGKTWQKIDDSAFHAVSCADGTCWAVGAKGKIAVLKQ